MLKPLIIVAIRARVPDRTIATQHGCTVAYVAKLRSACNLPGVVRVRKYGSHR